MLAGAGMISMASDISAHKDVQRTSRERGASGKSQNMCLLDSVRHAKAPPREHLDSRTLPNIAARCSYCGAAMEAASDAWCSACGNFSSAESEAGSFHRGISNSSISSNSSINSATPKQRQQRQQEGLKDATQSDLLTEIETPVMRRSNSSQADFESAIEAAVRQSGNDVWHGVPDFDVVFPWIAEFFAEAVPGSDENEVCMTDSEFGGTRRTHLEEPEAPCMGFKVDESPGGSCPGASPKFALGRSADRRNAPKWQSTAAVTADEKVDDTAGKSPVLSAQNVVDDNVVHMQISNEPEAAPLLHSFTGSWQCVDTWGLQSFLEAEGFGMLTVQAAIRAPWPSWEFVQDQNQFMFTCHSCFGDVHERIQVGGQSYTTRDGKNQLLRSRAFWEQDTLVIQRSGPQGSYREDRRIDSDGLLRFTLTSLNEGSTSKWGRTFKRDQPVA